MMSSAKATRAMSTRVAMMSPTKMWQSRSLISRCSRMRSIEYYLIAKLKFSKNSNTFHTSSPFMMSSLRKIIPTSSQSFVTQILVKLWRRGSYKLKHVLICIRLCRDITTLPKRTSFIEILNQPIYSYATDNLKLLISALQLRYVMPRNQTSIMWDLLFIWLLNHFVKTNTPWRLTSGHLESSSTRCWLVRLHGRPRMKRNFWERFKIKKPMTCYQNCKLAITPSSF